MTLWRYVVKYVEGWDFRAYQPGKWTVEELTWEGEERFCHREAHKEAYGHIEWEEGVARPGSGDYVILSVQVLRLEVSEECVHHYVDERGKPT